MPTLCFLPWASLSQRARVGQFHLVPCGEAITSGAIPKELRDGVAAVLVPYGKPRAVDRRKVPLIYRDDVGVLDELTDDLIEAYFDFRQRLGFSVLSARRFFQHRYSNSANASLVVQRFTPEHAGATVITSRRRDGSVNNIIPKGSLQIRRPEHASSWCELPSDLDLSLLEALEGAAESVNAEWPRLADAIRLFVGANTDSPDVSEHNELVDMVSAFSRVANSWNEDGTAAGFINTMPSPAPIDIEASDNDPLPAPGFGPKLKVARMRSALTSGSSVREIWLRDAYRLRSQVGHGHVTTSPYKSIWTVREHLLLGAVAFPLYVKRMLQEAGLYEWTRDDRELDEIFDALVTLEPFATVDDDAEKGVPGDGADGSSKRHPWREAFYRSSTRRLARLLYAEWDKIDHAQHAVTDDDGSPPKQ